MTNFYDLFMSPMEDKWLAQRRAKLMAHAYGNVLEIGFGTGANLPYYDRTKLKKLTALDLEVDGDAESKARAKLPDGIVTGGHLNLKFVAGRAESLPFESESFDVVVETLVLCSVTDLDQSIQEIYRVLKPGGLFLFMDHVLPEKPVLSGVFKGLNWIWPHVAHGCQLTRSPHLLLAEAGFSPIEIGQFGKTIFRYGVLSKA